MRRIEKSPEPAALVAHREHGGSYDSLHRADIRPQLLEDQRGLCCYCLKRLKDRPGQIKVEHFRPQHRHPELELSWHNLFAACRGGMGQPPAQQHCDTAKGGQRCDLDPLTVREADFRYHADGRISHQDPELDRQLNEVLHLNTPAIRRRRQATLDGFIRAMSQRKGTWPRAVLERELTRRLEKNPLDPYCMVIAGWLRRKLRQR